MRRIFLSMLVAVMVPAAGGCSKAEQPAPQPAVAAPRDTVSLVADRSLVCMVNDQFMGRAQIPVEVEGRTYYGCCEMCKTRLAQDASVRSAIDPVSARPVDKSQAVIGMDDKGTVLYFESKENFTAYAQRTRAN